MPAGPRSEQASRIRSRLSICQATTCGETLNEPAISSSSSPLLTISSTLSTGARNSAAKARPAACRSARWRLFTTERCASLKLSDPNLPAISDSESNVSPCGIPMAFRNTLAAR